MGRIIIVSNRLPITIDRKQGELIYHPSAGGLATGLGSLDQNVERLWIGWPGKVVDSEREKEQITEQFRKDGMYPVFLSNKEISLSMKGSATKPFGHISIILPNIRSTMTNTGRPISL